MAVVRVAVIVGAAVLGAGVGAFLPRLAYRFSVPYDTAPAGGCPHCMTSLGAGIRGWLGGGRCLTCRSPLTPYCRLYSAVGAAAFALLIWRLPHRHLADVVLLAAWLVAAVCCIVLAAVDIHARRLPTPIVATTATLVGVMVIAAAVISGHPALVRNAAMAAVGLGSAFLALALARPGQLGMGDVRLAALCGLLLGAQGWRTVLLGAVLPYILAAVTGTVLLLTRYARGDTQIPFGPYLVAGTLVAGVVVGGS
jgi:leader peptidase (prepilin peptidase)/N-methyltransferase